MGDAIGEHLERLADAREKCFAAMRDDVLALEQPTRSEG
jgi:hypothetical protein